jgi:hypothetical protein
MSSHLIECHGIHGNQTQLINLDGTLCYVKSVLHILGVISIQPRQDILLVLIRLGNLACLQLPSLYKSLLETVTRTKSHSWKQ